MFNVAHSWSALKISKSFLWHVSTNLQRWLFEGSLLALFYIYRCELDSQNNLGARSNVSGKRLLKILEVNAFVTM